jgi:hypothetical protein
MTPQKHQEFAERISRSMEKLRDTDYEAVIEGAMLAGTHWLNVALHKAGVSEPEHDVLHVAYMVVHERFKAHCLFPAAVEALETIEAMRARHVRGNAAGGAEAAAVARNGLDTIRVAALAAGPMDLTPPKLGRVSLDRH